MKFQTILAAAVLGSTVALTLGLAPQDAKPALTQVAAGAHAFAIDPVHSSVIFKIGHIGVSNFYGAFKEIGGNYSVDASNPGAETFNIEVKTESIDSRNGKRDAHLKSPDFFNVAEFPTITFKSTKAESAGENRLKVTGDLTLHGVTKSLTTEMQVFPAKQTPQGFKGGFETTFTIKRTDFGMDTYVANGGLGDDVTITVAVEGVGARP